ncbi:thioredoxin domain-containing protein [Patescibacteria group bacterium]|nr:thioredoxin domain-containing protein [Patescibacteria group bacterium]
MQAQETSVWPIAIAIIVVGAMIAYALYSALRPEQSLVLGQSARVSEAPPITEADHVLGNPDAPIKIITYTDLDCPYCRSFHAVMKQLMAVYGTNGSVAWVYRHFPLVELHPNAPALAEASECAAELGGTDAFWKFMDGAFTADRLNDRFDMTQLEPVAASAGVPLQQFRDCMSSGRHRAAIKEEFEDAKKAGATGTPFSIVMSAGNPALPISGSRSFGGMQDIIESLRSAGGY